MRIPNAGSGYAGGKAGITFSHGVNRTRHGGALAHSVAAPRRARARQPRHGPMAGAHSVKPALLVVSVLVLAAGSTVIALRIRREEVHHSASRTFAVGLTLFNLLLYGLLAVLAWR